MKRVRKAVFPVAGLGTRFLPATKAVPKEMLTVVDRPVIQYVVDEAREAGIEHFIFVTGRNKAVIEDHFDIQFELNHTLAQRGKDDQLAKLQRLQPLAGQTSFTRQQEPLGRSFSRGYKLPQQMHSADFKFGAASGSSEPANRVIYRCALYH